MTKYNPFIQKILAFLVLLFIMTTFLFLPKNVFAQENNQSQITVIRYSADTFESKVVNTAQEAKNMIKKGYVTWIDIQNCCNKEDAQQFVEAFNLSSEIAPHISDTSSITQMKEYNNYLFFVLKTLDVESSIEKINLEHVSMVWSHDYIITFGEKENTDAIALRQLIENKINENSWSGYELETGYLSYIILDTIVDKFFIAVDLVVEQLNVVEQQSLDHKNPDILKNIYDIKREITTGRKIIWPMRNILNYLTHYKYDFISDDLKKDLLNVYDNLNYLNEATEMLSINTSEIVNFYISSTSHHTNNILRFLTIVSTILFILSFIGAIYGINLSQFHDSQKRKTGHVVVIITMVIMAILLLTYFWIINWI